MKRIQSLTPILGALCAVALVGCGGGGGGDSVPDYSGAWSTNVSLVSNTCPRAIPEEFKFLYVLHNVNQSVSEDALGNKILDIVLDDGKDTYIGVGEIGEGSDGDRFTVTGAPHELPGFLRGNTCIETIDFDYDSIVRDANGNVAANFVTRHSSITCTKAAVVTTCDVTYTGTGYGSR